MDPADVVAGIDGLHPRTIRNYRMQYRLARYTLIPWLKKLGVLPQPAAVIEIGCAEGGVVGAFVEQGTTLAAGTDIMGPLLTQISEPLAKRLGFDITFSEHDVIYQDPLPEWRGVFDVVVLRDVIEHLDDAGIALKNIAKLLKPGGVVLLTFPPYTSPFGGHQQLLGTTLGKLPFVHLLPKRLFNKIITSGDPQNAEEVERLHRIRLSADDIHRAGPAAGLQLMAERYFLLRPVFRWKYQKPVPTIEMTGLKGLKAARTLAMEAAFVLRKPAA